MSFTPCLPVSFISLTLISALHPWNLSPLIKKHTSVHPYIHTNNNRSKTKHRKKKLIVEAVVCHSVSTVYPSVHTSSLANVHCSESLVWFKISGFCDTHQYWILVRIPPRYPAVALCVMGHCLHQNDSRA